jgi:hypothetical protein
VFQKYKSEPQIKDGDRFVKSDDSTIVWVVTGEGSAVTPILHYQVSQENRPARCRTLSEQTLLDRNFYRRLD